MKLKQSDMLHGSIWRSLVAFFIPCWLGMLFQQFYNLVDTWIVGRYVGTEAVAAVGNVSVAVAFVLGVCVSVANGAGVVVAQHFGAGEEKRVRTDVRVSMVIALIGGAVLTAVCVGGSGWMVAILDTPIDIEEDSFSYLWIYFCALIPNLIYNFGTALLRGVGDSKRPLYILIVTSVVNILLDLLFVLLFDWKVYGVAIATDISQVVSAVLIVILLFRQFPGWLKRGERQGRTLWSIFRIGLPSALQSMMYSSSNMLIQVAINSFATPTIAAWSIYGKVDCISWMTMSSMGMAVTAFAGQNFGAKQYDRLKQCAKTSSVLLGVAVAVLVVIFCAVARPLFVLFTDDAEVIDIGVEMMLTLTPAYLLYFLIEILPGIVRGCGDVLIPTIASIIGICVVRVLWLEFVVPVHHTLFMVMLSYIITWGSTSVFYVLYFMHGRWLKRCIRKATL